LGTSITSRASAVPFSSRPNMFVANVNNGCSTVEMFDVVFPDPGPNVQGASEKPASPRGQNCGAPKSSSTSTTTSRATTTATSMLPRPDTTSSSTASSSTSNPAGTAKLWAKCGGIGWTGPTRCEYGLECHRQSEWYSQCRPGANKSTKEPVATTSTPRQYQPTSTSATTNPSNLAVAWGQCGGVSWNGPKACEAGLLCSRQSEWYSQCIPLVQQSSHIQPTTTSTSGSVPQLSAAWAQCGGHSWGGPKACQAGLVCHRQSEWYSQCIPRVV
jgi:hypothetical protein